MFGSFPPSPLVGLRLQSLLGPGSQHCYGIITLDATDYEIYAYLQTGQDGAVASASADDAEAPKPTADEKCSDDVAFFREVLKEGHSLIVVRTESQQPATSACEVLDRLGLGMQNRTPVKMQTSLRHVGDVAVLDISGRITLGEGNVMLREIVRELAEKGNKKIVLNLGEVQYVDSSGIGELVKTHTTVRNQGGQLRLVNLNKRVNALLQMTRLSAVFDIEGDEASAIKSMGRTAA
jgi:anti-sigma B factor antagonist